jgi:hypothetical protein
MLGKSLVAAQLAAYQEGLPSMESVCLLLMFKFQVTVQCSLFNGRNSNAARYRYNNEVCYIFSNTCLQTNPKGNICLLGLNHESDIRATYAYFLFMESAYFQVSFSFIHI